MSFGTPASSGSTWTDRSAKNDEIASKVPMLLGIVSSILSMVLAIWTMSTAQSAPLIGSFAFPFAAVSTLPLSIAGYVLTPFLTIAALAWDQIAQRRGLRNRNFALKPKYSTVLRWLAVFGFILGAWHILNIANALAGG